ncbi:MAG: prepilin-type N-terminal cleavage/methylation domain-containing protein [bacterium]
MNFLKKNKNRKNESGFTLMEMMIIIFLIVVTCTIVFYNYSAHRNNQALNNGEDEIISILNEARSRTLSGENNAQYGVHFQTNKAVLFSGATFATAGTSTSEINLDTTVQISGMGLAGGVSDIVFKKVTGNTDAYGTLTLTSAPTSLQKTITITKNGFVSGN